MIELYGFDPNSNNVNNYVYEIVDNPIKGGNINMIGNKIIYTPKQEFVGVDYFTYRLKNNQNQYSNTERVTIIVQQMSGRVTNKTPINLDNF